MPEGKTNPIILQDFSGGWVSKKDQESDALAPNESPDLENVDFDGKGSFRIRRGFELFGNRTATGGDITVTHTMIRPIRKDEVPIRQRGTALEYYHTGTSNWETVPVVGSITSGAKVGFTNFTSATDVVDYVYYCDGVMALERWNGGHSLLNGALSGGEGTVTVDSTAGFITGGAGSIDIGGSTVTYTGTTATTFTGCSGVPAAADNAPVEQLGDAFAASSGAKPVGNILVGWNAQLVVADEQFVKISDTADFTDWGSGLATTKGFSGGVITGLTVQDKKLLVFTENSIQAIEYEFTGDQTGFILRTENIETTPGYGSKVFTGITKADNEVYYVAADSVVRRVVRSPVSALFDTGSISENIKNTLKDYTLTNAVAAFYRNKLYFAVQSDESDINDLVLVFDLKYSRKNASGEAWTKYRMYVNDFFVYGGNFFAASSATPNTFRLFENSSGDAILEDDDAAIAWYYTTPQLDFGQPHLNFRFTKYVSRGFISSEAEITNTVLYDYGTESEQETTLDGDDSSWVNTPALLALGEGVVGEGEAGAAVDPFDGVYPFTYIENYGTIDAYNTQVKISGKTAGEQYKQTKLILYIEPQDDVMTN